MTFTEPPFVILFAIVYPLWLLAARNARARLHLLLAASFVFYGHDEWALLLLLVTVAVVDWRAGLAIANGRRPGRALAAGVGFNLVVLATCKYTPLLAHALAPLAGVDSSAVTATFDGWVVPFGVSFYAFTGIAYLADVYRRTAPAEPRLEAITLYLSFFPHLMAGPILRPNELLHRLHPRTMPRRPLRPVHAIELLGRGYFKKLVLADTIAVAVDPFFAQVGTTATAGVWALPYLYLYAFQIFFDFSGYTDIARGLALLFGFDWPENFARPYLAASPREFWRRWHMTLSAFLRDYVYVPLGGDRHGPLRTSASLLVTMLLGGMWHGGSWSFLVWGGIHGLLLMAHRAWRATPPARRLARLEGAPRAVWRLVTIATTFHCVTLAWSFFRVTDLQSSLACLRMCFVFDPQAMLAGGSGDPAPWILLAAYGAACAAAAFLRRRGGFVTALDRDLERGMRIGFALALLALAVLLAPFAETPPFIYFQF